MLPVPSSEQDRSERCTRYRRHDALGHYRPVHVKSKPSQLLRVAICSAEDVGKVSPFRSLCGACIKHVL